MLLKIGNSGRRLAREATVYAFLRPYVVIPLAAMSVYLGLSALLLPAGVNRVFATRLAEIAIPTSVFLWVVVLAAARLARFRLTFAEDPAAGIRADDLLLLLLPLTPVTQYLIRNAEVLAPLDVPVVLFSFALLAAVLVLLIPYLLRRTGATRPTMYAGLALVFTVTNMAVFSKQFRWHDWVSLKILVPVLAGIWLCGVVLFQYGLRSVLHTAIVAFFATNTLIQLASQDSGDSIVNTNQDNALVRLVGSRKPSATPSIYLLVYDSYVASETMAAHGIDNLDQERYLRSLGFKIYPHTYSLAGSSLKSMSRVLNATAEYTLDTEGRTAVSGSGIIQGLLTTFGYTTYGVFPSDFFFRGTTPTYDRWYPPPSSSAVLLITAILEGEFRFDLGFDKVSRAEFLQEKHNVLADSSRLPRFLYSHSRSPGHTQMSGVCLPEDFTSYARDVGLANLEMKDDVETILENDPGAIVIVAGDHGPRLTKNCASTGDDYDVSEISRLDIQDRLGAFLAIRWPSDDVAAYDQITVLQDLFPAVFAYMFQDPGMLQARPGSATVDNHWTSGARVVDGVIVGGLDDGEPLFLRGPTE